MKRNGEPAAGKTQGHCVRMAREEHGWTQAELANRVNVSTKTVKRWEGNQASPRPHEGQQLCTVLGRTREELALGKRAHASSQADLSTQATANQPQPPEPPQSVPSSDPLSPVSLGLPQPAPVDHVQSGSQADHPPAASGSGFLKLIFSKPPRKLLLSLLAVLLLIGSLLTYYESPQEIYQRATTGTPTIADPLSQQDNYGWFDDTWHVHGHIASCGFSQGAYHARAEGQQANCLATNTNFSDLAYQVQVTTTRGCCSGLILRASQNARGGGYYFGVTTDGTYRFVRVLVNSNGTFRSPETIKSGDSPAIKRGINQPNLLTVVARGTTFSLYINEQSLTSVGDTTYTSGLIGVYAGNGTDTVEASFHNAQVWTLTP